MKALSLAIIFTLFVIIGVNVCSPASALADPAEYLYVSAASGTSGAITGVHGNVYVIDPRLNTIRQTLTGFDDCPRQIVASHDGKKVYVVDFKGIKAIDTATNAVPASYALEITGLATLNSEPLVALSPDDRRIYLVDNDNSMGPTLKVYDTATFAPIYSNIMSDTADMIDSIALSPDGNYLYVSVNGATLKNYKVLKYDTAKMGTGTSPLLLTSDSSAADHLAVSPDGSILYPFGLYENDGKYSSSYKIMPAHTTDLACYNDYDPGKNPKSMVFAPGGKYAYIANADDGTVTVMDLSSGYGTTIKTVAVGGWPSTMVLSGDGKKLFVARSASNQIAVINTDDYSFANISVPEESVYGMTMAANVALSTPVPTPTVTPTKAPAATSTSTATAGAVTTPAASPAPSTPAPTAAVNATGTPSANASLAAAASPSPGANHMFSCGIIPGVPIVVGGALFLYGARGWPARKKKN